jgi:hypothetical protein
MKKKALIFVIILTIIASMIVFKPLPAKTTSYYTFTQSPTKIWVGIDTTKNVSGGYIAYNRTSQWDYDACYTSNFQYSFALVDNSTGSTIYSDNFSVSSFTNLSTAKSIHLFISSNGDSYTIGTTFANSVLKMNNTYTFYLTIKGQTTDIMGYVNVTWNVNAIGSFTLTQTQVYIPVTSKDVSLSFQGYDCNTHIATFGVNVVGYNTVDFSMVSTQKVMGKEYVVSYTYDSVNKILKVYFTSDIPNGDITLSLGITVDNTMSLLKDITFKNSCSVQQTIQPGKLYITSPPAEIKYDSPQAGGDYYYISFSFAYGGSVIHDFGSDWGLANSFIGSIFVSPAKVNGGTLYSLIGVGPSEIDVMFQDGYTYKLPSTIEWTYDSTHNVSYLTVNIPLIKDYQPGMNADITIGFDLSGNNLLIHSENTVHIIIGQAITSTGNPILDFLIKTWNEFKNWFIETMKFLFVPDSSQIAQQLQTGWIDIKNTQLLPNVSSSRYLTVKMPKELFGNNNTVQIDFGKMTEWSGWSNVKTITRGLVWLVFVYILIGMVT